MKSFILVGTTIFACLVQAQTQYSISEKNAKDPSIQFSIKYDLGTHKGSARQVDGFVVLDSKDQVLKADFKIPIVSLTTNNETRDCHMVEALGIDYTNSDFPKNHVCDDNNQLPLEGPNAVAYPFVELSFISLNTSFDGPLTEGSEASASAKMKLKIHGVEKEISDLPLTVVKVKFADGNFGIRVKAKIQVLRSDFGIEVKKFKIGFIKIGVDNEINLDVNMLLSK